VWQTKKRTETADERGRGVEAGETTPGDWIKDKVMYEFNALT